MKASQNIPKHVAIIMDGNGRWAQARGLHGAKGHSQGAEAVRRAVRAFRAEGVQYLTLYAFSVANWSRPQSEVKTLMQLLAQFAEQERHELKQRGIRLAVVGDIDELPTPARRALEDTVALTAEGQEMVLSLALSYGGRRDLVDAMRALAIQVNAGLLLPEEIDEARLRAEMSTRDLPPVDLLIRTGGASRVSDFMLFDSAYAELLMLSKLWPDFDERDVRDAILYYSGRERRFGLTSTQIAAANEGQGFDPYDSFAIAAE
jgi:undecaprenyl diphosphate synthase